MTGFCRGTGGKPKLNGNAGATGAAGAAASRVEPAGATVKPLQPAAAEVRTCSRAWVDTSTVQEVHPACAMVTTA